MSTLTIHSDQSPVHGLALATLYAGLAIWFSVVLALGLEGAFSSSDGRALLALPVAIFVPVVAFALAYRASRPLRRFVLALDTRVLVLLHTWRMLGLGFVFLYFHDILPGVFALPAGLGDAIAAAWALVVGTALYRSGVAVRRHLLAWNTFALGDFVLAVTLGLLARPGPLQLLSVEVTTAPMGEFPLFLIPAFGVPLFAITHLVVYLQVRDLMRG